MSSSNSQSGSWSPISIITLVLVVFIIWALAGGRPLFRNTGRDIKTTVQDAGQDIKTTGRNVADSIRNTVQ